MSFNSLTYIVLFLPAVAFVHGLLRKSAGSRASQTWLLAASLFFYAFAALKYLPILVASVVFNWGIARVMMAQTDLRRRRLYLWIGLSVDILVLFLFKYVQLFLDTIHWFHGPLLVFPDWGFPLGVSFFTLNQIMYLVDAFPRAPTSPAALKIFRGLSAPNSFFDHLTFVTLFPYVVSGPLVRVRATVPQLGQYTLPEPAFDRACRGFFLFAIGLAKKVVLADSFAPIADAGFGTMSDYSMTEAWIFCFAGLLHVYFDFSGYSDMAQGSAWMLGIDIPQNFKSPLKARSIFEFWQRWHISLSNFITDYLFKPILNKLGRPTQLNSAVAVLLAMTIAALWHGPAWTFVAWGIAHGTALAIRQVWTRHGLSMPGPLARVLTLMFLTATIVFLRASSLADAGHMLSRLVPHANPFAIGALEGLMPFSPTILLRPVFIGAILALFFKSSAEIAATFRPGVRTALMASAAFLLALLYLNSVPARTFVYFAF